ncbi:MAG: hypothetical protein HC836_25595 [Richelia sp. RM2_1_2]|nr:hypothetical protein [Richelia sp. RM2_1_2]
MFKKTNIQFSIERALTDLQALQPMLDESSVVCLTCKPTTPPDEQWIDGRDFLHGSKERDYNQKCHFIIGTYFEYLIDNMPFNSGRVRIFARRPRTAGPIHWDPTRRFHFVLKTDPGRFIVETDKNTTTGTFHHIPADGFVYEMEAEKLHFGLHVGNDITYHVVFAEQED